MLKTIMSQIWAGDWFVTVNLKDDYFHIQVILRYRKFPWFAFGGTANQYKVLPFGQADSGSPVEGEGEGCLSLTRSPVLAIPDVVFRADSSSVSALLGDFLSGRTCSLRFRARSGTLNPISGSCGYGPSRAPGFDFYLLRFWKLLLAPEPLPLGSCTLPNGRSLSLGAWPMQ